MCCKFKLISLQLLLVYHQFEITTKTKSILCTHFQIYNPSPISRYTELDPKLKQSVRNMFEEIIKEESKYNQRNVLSD